MRKNKSLILVSLMVQLCACSGGSADQWKRDFDAGYTCAQSCDYAGAEKFYKQALKNAGQVAGADYRRAQTLKELGDTYLAQQRYDEAEPGLKEALELYEKAWHANEGGEDSRGAALNAAAVLLRLGKIDAAHKNLGPAEEKFQRALAIEREQLGSDSLQQETAETYVKLLTIQGRRKEAKRLLSGVAMTEASDEVAADDLKNEEWTELFKAAQSALHAGNLSNALKLAEHALSLAERDHKPWRTATTLETLGEINLQLRKYPEALRNLNMSLAVYKTLPEEKNLKDVCNLRSVMASVYRQQGNYETAEKTYEEAIASLPRDKNRRDERKWMELLAATYMSDKKFAQAETVLRKKLEIEKEIYDDSSPKIPYSIVLLAAALAAQNKATEADGLYKKAIALQVASAKADPRHVLRLYDDYAAFLRKQNRTAEADAIENKARVTRSEYEKGMYLK